MAACKSTEKVPLSMEDNLVEKNIEALGGLENIQAIQSLKLTGAAEMMGYDLTYVLYQKRPGKARTEISMDMMGEIISAYDGETAWSINPLEGGGAQVLPEGQDRNIKDQANIGSMLVGYQEKGLTLEYVGEEEVKGTATHNLKVIRPDGSELFVFLDAASYLIIKTETETLDAQSGSMMTVETYSSDYRDVNGLMMPFEMEMVVGGGQFVFNITFSDAEANIDVDDAIFTMPGS